MNETIEVQPIIAIAKDIEYIKRDMGDIKETMKALPGQYLTQKEHTEFVSAVNTRFGRIESSSTLWKWLSPIVGAILGSVITFLFVSYLTNLKGNG